MATNYISSSEEFVIFHKKAQCKFKTKRHCSIILKLVIVNYKIKLNLLRGKQWNALYSFIKALGGKSVNFFRNVCACRRLWMKPTNHTWLLLWESWISSRYLSKTGIHYCQSYKQTKKLSFPLIGALEIILNGPFYKFFFFHL